MKFKLSQSISHPTFSEPFESEVEIYASSLATAVKQLRVSGEVACDLKSYNKASYVDGRGATFTFTIEEIK